MPVLISILCLAVFSAIFERSWSLAGVVLFVAVSVLTEMWQFGLHAPVTALNLEGMRSEIRPPLQPDVPTEWRPLLSLARPREVYLPLRAKTIVLLRAALLLGFGGYSIHVLRRQGLRGSSWLFPLFVTVLLYVGLRQLRQELSARTLLREGEVTIGRVTDWRSRGHGGAHVVYQFWTRTGQRFERDGAVISQSNSDCEGGLVPVFYAPENPSKSVALCCALSTIKLPDTGRQKTA